VFSQGGLKKLSKPQRSFHLQKLLGSYRVGFFVQDAFVVVLRLFVQGIGSKFTADPSLVIVEEFWSGYLPVAVETFINEVADEISPHKIGGNEACSRTYSLSASRRYRRYVCRPLQPNLSAS